MRFPILFAVALLFGAGAGLQAQSEAELQMMYQSFADKRGYEGFVDGDGDYQFKADGYTYFFEVDEDDPLFFRLVLANIWEIESEMERLQVLKAADAVNYQLKAVKIFTVEDNVWVGIEVLQADVSDFERQFDRYMTIITEAVDRFKGRM